MNKTKANSGSPVRKINTIAEKVKKFDLNDEVLFKKVEPRVSKDEVRVQNFLENK